MKTRIYYGWIVVLSGTALMATVVGIVNNCFGLYIVPACRELGFTRQQMGLCQTMLALGSMVVALFSGAIFPRANLKRLMGLGAIVMCLGYALFSVAHTLAQFYLIALVVALAQGLVNVVPLSIILGNWFNEKRGMAIGLTFMGSGLGGMLFNMIGGQLIAAFGWRATVLVFSGILCAVVLPIVFFVIKVKPEDMGLLPLGAQQAPADAPPPSEGLPLKRILRTSTFYLLALDIAVAGMAVNAIATTATPFYTDVFGSETIGANLSSAFMAVLAVGKFALGALYDRLGARSATTLARVLLVISLLALSQGARVPFIVVYLLSCGLACASSSVSMPILARSAFGAGGSVAITGIFSAAQSLGGLIAPAFGGWICDMTGSYAPSYQLLTVAVIATIFPMYFALSRKTTP